MNVVRYPAKGQAFEKPMREVEVGCKITEGGGMEAFGDQEVADCSARAGAL